ncbi:protein cueball [Condylostylus longicornis]|uniref:protein cueball n=1 Tax=Condylostylus longicornis TaxID=2530218 RepID=UPI00244DFCED|nr:protein cueball [Condylostylus longicornis]
MCYKSLKLFIILIFCIDKSSVMSLWDFAATAENKIIFFDKDWNEVSSAAHQFTKLSGLAFDEIEEKLYFSDQNHNNGSIFSLKLPNNINGISSNSAQLSGIINGETKIEIIEKIVARIKNETIGGITYDPYDRYLYWTDKSNKKIYRLYTSSLAENRSIGPEIYLNLSNDSIPEGITIDICNRMLYWSNSNIRNPSIQRIALNSNYRNSEILINKNLFQPRGIVTDQYSKRIFWVVNLPGIHYAVESSNLDGTDRKTVYEGLHSEPYDLTVTKSHIFWTDLINEAVWNISKTAGNDTEPGKSYSFKDRPRGIISRSGFLTKLTNVPECKEIILTIKNRLKEHINMSSPTLLNSTTAIKSINLAKPHVYCLNKGEYNPLSDACICKVGFSGLRCEIDDCTNYCVHGTCEISSMGFPECVCNEGFYGIRCEAYKCSDYCLNDGFCEINENKPSCECNEQFTGERCEQNLTETCTLFCSLLKYNPNYEIPFKCHDICYTMNELNNTETHLNEIYKNLKRINKHDFIQNQQKHQMEDHDISKLTHLCSYNTYIIAIICLSILLALTIVLLIIFAIRKTFKPPRPKIRKTFVVQKRVDNSSNNCKNLNCTNGNTPLTSRPLSAVEKCEITIEDCCNMNICDTPCFDPKVLQQSFDNYSKNDDKKTLVDNMEEDLY